MFTIDFTENEPLYEQLYNYIKNKIKSNGWNSNTKMPSKRALANHLKISVNTVETAYDQLVSEGYIYAKPRSGYYICEIDPFAEPISQDPVNSVLCTVPESVNKTKAFKYDFRTDAVDTSEFPFSVWSKLSRAILRTEGTALLNMTETQGDYGLRCSIAKYLNDYRHVKCNPEQIVVGAGTEYLFGLLVQLLGNDNVYALEYPGYSKPYKIISCLKTQCELIKLDDQGISINDLESCNANIVYVTPSHHFPLGTVMTATRRHQLLNWANKSYKHYIIEDDFDSEFRFHGRPIPALQGLDQQGKVIYISTFSKSMAPSLRLSYMVLPPALLSRFKNSLGFYSSTVSGFEQLTISRFIDHGYFERHLNRMRLIYRQRKEKLTNLFRSQRASAFCEIIQSKAGLHVLLKIISGHSEKEFIDAAARHEIGVYGLSKYYYADFKDSPAKEPIIILGFAHLNIEEIEEAAQRLIKVWSEI